MPEIWWWQHNKAESTDHLLKRREVPQRGQKLRVCPAGFAGSEGSCRALVTQSPSHQREPGTSSQLPGLWGRVRPADLLCPVLQTLTYSTWNPLRETAVKRVPLFKIQTHPAAHLPRQTAARFSAAGLTCIWTRDPGMKDSILLAIICCHLRTSHA